MIFKPKTLLLLTLMGPVSTECFAQSRCAELFGRRSTVLQSISSEVDEPLAEPLKKRILEHAIGQWARSVPDQGKGLSFLFRGSFLAQFKPDKSLKGEAQQATLIKKYLQFLMPQAEFRSRSIKEEDAPVNVPRGRRQIELYIRDQAESSKPKHVDDKIILNMPTLKAGNPGALNQKASELRAIFGIPKNKKVVSLYINDEKLFRGYGNDIVSEIRKTYDMDILFVSFGNVMERGFSLNYKNVTKINEVPGTFEKFFSLSDLIPIDLAQARTAFVINDTVGFLPQVHAVADLAVVVGPINFIQPLNVGTKTVAVLPPQFLSDYNTTTLNDLQQVARSSGGFATASTLEQIPGAINQVLAGSFPVSPAFQNIGGRSPIEKVLDALEELIKSQN